ncbi:MAG: pyruvate dehydrogenase complex dihydrolipoamide acetyltransferase [Pseudomonadota bacterium]
MPVESIKVPNLGDSKDVEVIELLVKPGQSVKENDSLMVLESDKAAMEIPSPKSGVVKSLSIKLGDQVSEGDEILLLEVEGVAAAPAAAKAEPAPSAAPAAPAPAAPAPAAASSPAAASAVEPIVVPDIGGDSDVEVIEVHVKVGDVIKAEQSLITLESDKAAMEVPSPKGGEVKALKLKVGDKVSKGSLILELAVAGAAAAPAAPAAASAAVPAATQPAAATVSAPAPVPVSTPAAVAPAAAASTADVYAGPAVRKLARELGVDLTQVSGSGARGRIQKEDLHAFVKARLQAPVAVAGSAGGAGIPAIADIDFSQFGSVEQVPLSKLHKVTAANMQRNWLNVPHVTQFNEADITDLEAFRTELRGEADKKGVKLTFLPFLLKACARALQEHKQFNVSLHSSGEFLIQKHYIHIGVAVATDAGLMVPVIRDVDKKSVWDLAREVVALSDKAKNRRLSKEEMQGACFTISSLGALGGTGFTPIVNAPEVAILGVSKTQTRPVYINGQFVPRQMLPIALSYDHRAVNGVDGGMFVTTLARLLGDIRLLAL